MSIRMYSAREAADYLGGGEYAVSVSTVNRWRKIYFLEGHRFGRAFYYTKRQLDACLGYRRLDSRIHSDELDDELDERKVVDHDQ